MALNLDRSEILWQEWAACLVAGGSGVLMMQYGAGLGLKELGLACITAAATWLIGRMTSSKVPAPAKRSKKS